MGSIADVVLIFFVDLIFPLTLFEVNRNVPHKYTTQHSKLWRVQPREILMWILNLSFYSHACKTEISTLHWF
jgi:hypothetical protein